MISCGFSFGFRLAVGRFFVCDSALRLLLRFGTCAVCMHAIYFNDLFLFFFYFWLSSDNQWLHDDVLLTVHDIPEDVQYVIA